MTSVDPRHLLRDEIRLVEVEVEVEVEARGLTCGLKSLREICPSACVFLCVCVFVCDGICMEPQWLQHGGAAIRD